MYVDDGITIDQIEGTSGTLSGVTTKSNIDGTKTRSIIHFTYNGLASGFNDLDIDIKLKSKTDPQTTIYVVVYGVKGNVNNISVGLWDRFYYYDNDSLKYEVPINMNSEDIIGVDTINVDKIITNNLDVNNQIDMKRKKITGLGIGTRDDDAVNKLQVDAHILHVVTHRSYFYFTTDLNHSETDTVKFPTNINKYPFSTSSNNNDSNKLIISLDGYYKIIYIDYHKSTSSQFANDSSFKILNSEQSNNELFIVKLKKESDWTQFTINAIIKIENLSSSNKISLKIVGISPKLLGSGFSTFFIRYLYPLNYIKI